MTMPDLVAIVRATRASARALKRMQLARRAMMTDCTPKAANAYTRAEAAYYRAQQVLRDNPLPGDAPDSDAPFPGRVWP